MATLNINSLLLDIDWLWVLISMINETKLKSTIHDIEVCVLALKYWREIVALTDEMVVVFACTNEQIVLSKADSLSIPQCISPMEIESKLEPWL